MLFLRRNLSARQQYFFIGFFCLLSLVALSSIRFAVAWNRAGRVARINANKYLGKRVISIMAGATKVETYEVEKGSDSVGLKGEPLVLDKCYYVSSQGRTKDANFATRVSDVLIDSRLYEPDRDETRCFEPDVGYRFWKGSEYVDVFICFLCDKAKVYFHGREVATASWASFYNMSDDWLLHLKHKQLLRTAQEALPQDKHLF